MDKKNLSRMNLLEVEYFHLFLWDLEVNFVVTNIQLGSGACVSNCYHFKAGFGDMGIYGHLAFHLD